MTTYHDACTLLDADHRKVKRMFKDFEPLAECNAKSAVQKRKALADEICVELTAHAQIEEEIFYPALRNAMKAEICWMKPRLSTPVQRP